MKPATPEPTERPSEDEDKRRAYPGLSWQDLLKALLKTPAPNN